MILAALLTPPALAQPVSGAEKVGFADIFGWWVPAAGAAPRPAVIGLHGCDGLNLRNELNARERAMAELLRDRGYHVLLPEPCTVPLTEHQLRDAELLGALDAHAGGAVPRARKLDAESHGASIPGERPRRRDIRISGARIAIVVVRSRQSAKHKFVCYAARAVKTTRSSQCKHKSCCPSWT